MVALHSGILQRDGMKAFAIISSEEFVKIEWLTRFITVRRGTKPCDQSLRR
jgi:hypothetical protein